ncbi:WD repeat-containing protein CG11141 [Orussus abietinus]|uniref:WD repeat-containing protein CG11141 n=1 Tax=Orussus abietinus TaxID=222816 RepID=UPI0006267753|nr:WD repeat-containing protein CG11141 [Orussus abietinus]
MSSPMCEDGGPLREWAPLTMLLQNIPSKIQNGIFTQDINFTCIDAIAEFIAIGTNHGLVYWYSREKGDLQKLRCENFNSAITCIRLISTVDYMVAAGNDQGVVTVFQIPKTIPDSLPDSLKPKQKKQVERYNIADLHKSAVTCVEWSKNGMKLFSGDQDGLVVITEIDFYMHLSKSTELLNEKYSVVQLSYHQGSLLVSTIFRTIVVNINQNGKVSQVGQKERKTLGKLGAVFACRQSRVQETVIYASRPGLRLWEADKSGIVLKTLIFKDAIRCGYTEVELLNPTPESAKKNREEPTFGVMLPFCDDLLVTYSNDIIYVINPTTIAITSEIADLRHIIDVACTKDEIFILEGERNIIRIAYYPETNTFTSDMDRITESLGSIAGISNPVTGILEFTSKLKKSAIVPAIPFHKINPTNIIQSISALPTVAIGTDTTVVNAEEATEIPPIVPLNITTSLRTDVDTVSGYDLSTHNGKHNEQEGHVDRRHIFQEIGQQEFEDVVFTPERKSKKSGNKNQNRTESNLLPMNNDTSQDCVDGPNANDNESKTTYSSLLTLSANNDIMLQSGHRDLETMKKDVEDKEKLLAAVLNFDLSEYMTSNRIYSTDSSASNCINTIPYVGCNTHLEMMTKTINEMLEEERTEQSEHTDVESLEDDEESYRTELNKLESLGECSRELLSRKLCESKTVNCYNGDSGIDSNNSVDLGFEPSLNGNQRHTELDLPPTVLSQGFVTSGTIIEEGWVLL